MGPRLITAYAAAGIILTACTFGAVEAVSATRAAPLTLDAPATIVPGDGLGDAEIVVEEGAGAIQAIGEMLWEWSSSLACDMLRGLAEILRGASAALVDLARHSQVASLKSQV
jgi:hypothetical protein